MTKKETRGRKFRTQREFKACAAKSLGKEYVLQSAYKGMYEEIEVLHKPCGTIFKSQARYVQKSASCPVCNPKSRATVVPVLKKPAVACKPRSKAAVAEVLEKPTTKETPFDKRDILTIVNVIILIMNLLYFIGVGLR